MSRGNLKVYLLSGNPHKVAEASQVLKKFGIVVESVSGVKKLEIQSESLEEIARVAAEYAMKETTLRPLAVEDAGLFINALKGFPGPYSAYVFKTIGISGILKLMEGVNNRKARFVSVVALVDEDDTIHVFRGEVEGEITLEPRGEGGFGFDPIFKPLGHDKTFAEMSMEEKCEVSHRARAFSAAAKYLVSRRVTKQHF